MIRTIIVVILILGATAAMSFYYIGYDKAGSYYIGKQKKKRKSLRVGSPYYYGHYGSRGLRSGK